MSSYAPPPPPPPLPAFSPTHPPLPHSGMGITSFVIALISGLSLVLMVVVAIVFAMTPGVAEDTREESPLNYLLGTWMFVAAVLALVGVIFGIGGVLQKNRRRTFAIAGLVLNIALPMGLMFLMVLGLTMSDKPGWKNAAAPAQPQPSSSSLGLPEIIAIATAGAAFVLLRRRWIVDTKAELPDAPRPPCARCRKSVPAGATFCTRCGQMRQSAAMN